MLMTFTTTKTLGDAASTKEDIDIIIIIINKKSQED